MASRQQVEKLFEMWARWCHSGSVLPASGASVLSKMIDNHGLMIFGSGGSTPNLDCVESDIERALSRLYLTHPDTVKTVRFEYLGRFKDEDNLPLNQVRKAASMGVSIRTFERRLAKGRAYVVKQLESKNV